MGMSKAKLLIGTFLLFGVGVLLFARLGHHPLWDDEATTALYGKAIWLHGDTFAFVGHNLIAFRSGAELRNLRNRYMPPLGYAVAAPFVGLLGDTAFAARLPFAVCGLLTVALIVYWMWQDDADILTWVLIAMAIVGNVSFVLFSRQCRYYPLAMFLSMALAYLYLHRAGRRWVAWTIGLVSVCLLASNYLNYAALYACFLMDYLLWGRRAHRLKRSDWLGIWTPQLILGAPLLYIWNPLQAVRIWHVDTSSWFSDRVTLFGWNLREMNGCEFGVGVLIVLAPVLYLAVRDRRLVRGPLALLVYVLVITIASPQQVGMTSVATVRYLVPTIPLCMLIAVVAIRAVTARRAWLAVPLAAIAFGSNLLHGGPWSGLGRRTAFADEVDTRRLRSTLVDYVGELRSGLPTAYGATAEWINRNLEEEQKVWVLPNYATYPLMFHAPKVVYAWQLGWPPEEQFKRLGPIHFRGRLLPEFVIVFGPTVTRPTVQAALRGRYRQIDTIDRFWADLIRPELFYHAFRPIADFDRSDQAVYIFGKADVPPPP